MSLHLVAGAAGFVGSHLCDRLVADGAWVLAIDNHATGRAGNLQVASHSPRFRAATADVSVDGEAERVLREAQAEGFGEGRLHVWHLASPASPPDYLKAPLQTLRAGSRGTENLLALAHQREAAFFLASTSEVYGDPEVSPQPESYWGHVNPVGVRSVYDEAKRYAEAATMAYRRTLGVDTRIARIFNTYGPRMRLDDGRVVPNFIGQALRAEPLTIYGDGAQTRSFCFVADLVEGLVRLMDSSHPGPMNLGNPRETTILEFADEVERVAGRALPRRFLPLPQDDPRRRRPDIGLARAVLGWEPQVSLEQGLASTYRSFAASLQSER